MTEKIKGVEDVEIHKIRTCFDCKDFLDGDNHWYQFRKFKEKTVLVPVCTECSEKHECLKKGE